MPTYMTRQIKVQAFQLDEEDAPDWFETAIDEGSIRRAADAGYEIETQEGVIHAPPGHFIIMGVEDEITAVRPDIFDATYELLG